MGRRREQSGEQVRTSGVHHPRVVRRLLASTLRHGERQGRGRADDAFVVNGHVGVELLSIRFAPTAHSGAEWSGMGSASGATSPPPPAVPHPSAAPRPIDRRGWRGARHHTGFHRARAAPSGSWRERGVRSVVATERVWSARPWGTPYAHTCAESPRSGASNACHGMSRGGPHRAPPARLEFASHDDSTRASQRLCRRDARDAWSLRR